MYLYCFIDSFASQNVIGKEINYLTNDIFRLIMFITYLYWYLLNLNKHFICVLGR